MNQSLVPRVGTVILMAVAALLFTSCASGPSIFVNTDPMASFSTYRTYDFVAPLGTDEPGYSSVLSQYLRIATEREFRARGYIRSDKPDLLVNFNVETREKVETGTLPSGPRFGGNYGYRSGFYGVWGGYETRVTQYTEGTLTVDIVDAARKQLAWEGTVVGRVREEHRRSLQATIDRVVAEIFAKYPYRVAPAP